MRDLLNENTLDLKDEYWYYYLKSLEPNYELTVYRVLFDTINFKELKVKNSFGFHWTLKKENLKSNKFLKGLFGSEDDFNSSMITNYLQGNVKIKDVNITATIAHNSRLPHEFEITTKEPDSVYSVKEIDF